MLFNPLAGMIRDSHTGRFHPVILKESPLPGPPSDDKPVRFKSHGHHTTGFESRDDAIASIVNEMAQQLPGLRYLTDLGDSDKDMKWDSSKEGLPTISEVIDESSIVSEFPTASPATHEE